jgi:hypothetical protein
VSEEDIARFHQELAKVEAEIKVKEAEAIRISTEKERARQTKVGVQTLLTDDSVEGGANDKAGGDGGGASSAEEPEKRDADYPVRMTDGLKGTVLEDAQCSFPFEYNGNSYTTCIKETPPDPSFNSQDIPEWCCTVAKWDNQQNNMWGTCKPENFVPPVDGAQAIAASQGESQAEPLENDLVPIPKILENMRFTTWDFVAAGFNYSAAISESGHLYTWGSGDFGRLGHGDIIPRGGPTRVMGGTEYEFSVEVKKVILCPTHTIALGGGLAFTWGNNDYGQLGHDSVTQELSPRPVTYLLLKKIQDATCGDRHSIFLSTDNYAYSCGANDMGQLGQPNVLPTNFLPEPRLIRHPFVYSRTDRMKIAKIAAGATHSVLIVDDGRIFTFGSNAFGELGQNSWSISESGRFVGSLGQQKPISVCAGDAFTIVVTEQTRSDLDADALAQDIRATENRYAQILSIQAWYRTIVQNQIKKVVAEKMAWINAQQPLMYYAQRQCSGSAYSTIVQSETNYCSAKAGGISLNDAVKSAWIGRFTLVSTREHCDGSSAVIEMVATKNEGKCINFGTNAQGSFGSSSFLGYQNAENDPFPMTLHADGACSFDMPKEKAPLVACWSSVYTNTFMEGYAGGTRRGFSSVDQAKGECAASSVCGGVTLESNGQYTLRAGPRVMTSPSQEVTLIKGGCGSNAKKVTQVQFRTGGLVDLFLIWYSDGSSAGHGGYGGGWQPTFYLQKDEFLVEVKGKQDRNLHCVQVVTNKGRSSPMYGPCNGADFSFRAPDGYEMFDIVDAGGFCPPVVGIRTRQYVPPPGYAELGYVKILENAEYGGQFQNKYTPLVTGAFSQLAAVYKSGDGVWCSDGWSRVAESVDYKWMRCGPRYAFEFLVNNKYAVKQFAPLDLPTACAKPSTPTGDIICKAFFIIRPGDTVTPTWMEPSLGVSLSDNGGSIKVDIFGLPNKGYYNWVSGYSLDLNKAYFQDSTVPLAGQLGSIRVCPGCVGKVLGPGGSLVSLLAGNIVDSCNVVIDPTLAQSILFKFEGFLKEDRPHGMLFPPAFSAGLRHMDAAVSLNQLPVNQITLETWIRVNDYSSWGAAIGYVCDDGNDEKGFMLGYMGYNPCFALATKTTGYLTYMCLNQQFSRDTWYHFAAVYDGSVMRMYINGNLMRSGRYQSGDILYPLPTYVPLKGGNLFTVGAYHDADEYYPLTGMVADVRMWNIARSSADIRSTMRTQLAGDEYGLVYNWQFKELTGLTAANSKPGGAALSLKGPFSRVSMDKYLR